jgi:hypothetical protein
MGIKHLAYCVFRTTTDYNTGLEYRGFENKSRRGDYECNKSIKPERGVIKGAFIKTVVHCSVHAKSTRISRLTKSGFPYRL